VNIWKTFSEKFYEGKFGFLGGLEETWGQKRNFPIVAIKCYNILATRNLYLHSGPVAKNDSQQVVVMNL
jgi:hypothetical protein